MPRRRRRLIIALGAMALVTVLGVVWWAGRPDTAAHPTPHTDRIRVPAGVPLAADVCGHEGIPDAQQYRVMGGGVAWVIMCPAAGSIPDLAQVTPPEALTTGAQQVAATLDALPVAPREPMCPLNAGPDYDFVFGYGDGTAQAVRGQTAGCRFIAGRVGAEQVDQAFVQALVAQREHQQPPTVAVTDSCGRFSPVMPLDTARIVRVDVCVGQSDTFGRDGRTVPLPAAVAKAALADVRASVQFGVDGPSPDCGTRPQFVTLVTSSGETYSLCRSLDGRRYGGSDWNGTHLRTILWTPSASVAAAIERARSG